jgi:hypothetical protein
MDEHDVTVIPAHDNRLLTDYVDQNLLGTALEF